MNTEVPAMEGEAALRARLAQAKQRLETLRLIKNTLVDEAREGVCVLGADGSVELNAAAGAMFASTQNPGGPSDSWENDFGFFNRDGSRCEVHGLPGILALGGQRVPTCIVTCRSKVLPEEVTLEIEARPLPRARSISVFRDVTARERVARALEEQGAKLAASEAENAALVERLRLAIDQVATPVLRVARDVLVMPIIGVVDATRSGRAAERLLHEVASSGARWVIVDVTGVEHVDTTTADLFARVTRAVGLLGCKASISGMRPNVARTMVDLGLSLEGLPSHRNLRHALDAALRETRLRKKERRAARARREPLPSRENGV